MKKDIYASSSFVQHPITGRSIDTHLLGFIEDVVQEQIPYLTYYAEYTLRRIIGEPLWNLLEKWEQTEAGHCMAYLVLVDRVQIHSVCTDGNNTHLYMRIPNDQL